jgi:peptidyl-prolyl cis-trans isomerase B (cyclophilin B)
VRRALVLIVILLAAVALLACGKDDTLTRSATTPAGPETAVTTAPARAARERRDGCKAVPAPVPRAGEDRHPSKQRLSRRRRYDAVIRTNCGTIVVRLAVSRAPKTTASFAGLVRNRFFDGLTFHRVAKPGGNDYVIQGGDPLGTGNGGPGYTVVEPPPKHLKYRRYIVAMAKAQTEQPGTSGSKFFIVTAAEAPLDPAYALLGEVVGGKSVVRRIAAVPTDLEMPIDPVVMSSVRIRSRRR